MLLPISRKQSLVRSPARDSFTRYSEEWFFTLVLNRTRLFFQRPTILLTNVFLSSFHCFLLLVLLVVYSTTWVTSILANAYDYLVLGSGHTHLPGMWSNTSLYCIAFALFSVSPPVHASRKANLQFGDSVWWNSGIYNDVTLLLIPNETLEGGLLLHLWLCCSMHVTLPCTGKMYALSPSWAWCELNKTDC